MNNLIFLLFLASLALADSGEKQLAGYDPKTDMIADNYLAGAYLIYDCEEKHWTCVMESYFQECQEKRVRDLASQGLTHTCAPIGLLPSKKSCFQRQLFLTSNNHGTRFCLKDSWRPKNLD